MYSSFRALTLNGDDLREPEPAQHEFQILEWVAGQMHKTVLSSRSETKYFLQIKVHAEKASLKSYVSLRGVRREGVTPKPSQLWHQNP